VGEFPGNYGLHLADGCNWCLSADVHISPWLDEFATIMRLSEHSPGDSSRLIFLKMQDKADPERIVNAALVCPDAAAGWMFYDRVYLRIWHHHTIPDILCEIKDEWGGGAEYTTMWYSLQYIYNRSMQCGGLPFHAACMELDGQGVLLAATGGTGKSTCYRRVPEYWKPLCDDEALVVLNKQGQYRVHPFPTWRDYLEKRANNTWDVQYSVPLSGIFLIEQAESDEVKQLGTGQAAVLISESAYQVCFRHYQILDGEEKRRFWKQIFDNACKIAEKIPVFRLRVSLHGQFWKEIEKSI